MVLMEWIHPVIEILTGIATVIGIITCLWPSCVTHANYLYKLQENGDSLKKALKKLKNARDDVQTVVDVAESNPNEPMKRKDQVNEWLQSVTEIEDEIVRILQQVDQEPSRRCLGGYMLGRSIVQKIASLDELREKGCFEEVAYKLPPPSVQEEPTRATVGMKSMFDKVWSMFVEDEVRIMGLYGYGGVGKTTLLKQINNAFLKTPTSSSSSTTTITTTTTTHGFDVVILVEVSDAINIDAIQKKIGNRLGLSSSDSISIFNALTKKRFVLLLDDIWKTIDLQSIGVPPLENNKSKVIFTTRSETVCGHMDANIKFRVECLLWDEAWTLFQEKVGNETLNAHPEVPELAEDVARECGGLPLALITVGRAMSSKKTVREWNHAITILRKSASEFPGMSEEVLPILKRSYDSLPNDTLKSCFLYCALYPEYDSIKKSKLIDYWIGEGFISLISEFKNLDDARNKGYDVIGDLKGACLLESGGNEETQVKMNAVIRKLALWIAHEYCGNKMLIIKTSDLTAETSSSSSWYNNAAERIYLIPPPYDGETKVRPPPLKSPNLITLIHRHSHFCYSLISSKPKGFLSVLPQDFFEFTPLLRVLDLSYSYIKTFPISITRLVELRYLSLSCTFIQELPEELGKLVKLNYLDLSRMCLRKIPSEVIGSLLELRVLNLFDSRSVDWDLGEVYKLKHLNDVGITIQTQQNLNKLLSNQNLRICTTHLSLSWIPEEANNGMGMGMGMGMGIGIEQQPHLGSSCFQNLIQIAIEGCNGLKDLTWVGYVPNLKNLCVDYCEELEEIIIVVDDDLGVSKGGGDEISTRVMNNVQDVFKRLEILMLVGNPKLKSICSRNALAFPCLEELIVVGCPELKKLPFDFGSNPNNTLQKIVGERTWWNELRWEEEDHNNNNNNNNNNNDLLKSKFLPYFIEFSVFDDDSDSDSDSD